MRKKEYRQSSLDTPLGPMIAIGDEEFLYLLEFVDCRGLEREIERLTERTGATIIPGTTPPISSIKEELDQYFNKKLREFKTPLLLLGSHFQKRVWEELQKIPLGNTQAYSDIAVAIGKPTAFRAVANANGANQLAIIIPCHRVIRLLSKPALLEKTDDFSEFSSSCCQDILEHVGGQQEEENSKKGRFCLQMRFRKKSINSNGAIGGYAGGIARKEWLLNHEKEIFD